MTDKYGVVGNPIAHSLSPKIHTEFAKLTQQDLIYDKYLVELEEFEPAILKFQQQGIKGLNITAPFKERAYAICNELSIRAQYAKAVNTLKFSMNGIISGDNTDGFGLIKDVTINHRFSLTDKSILLIGAGGAARSLIKSLVDANPKQLVITNRTFDKAIKLVAEFKQKLNHASIVAKPFSELITAYDCIINATSAGLTDDQLELPRSLVHSNACCYEMVYGKQTSFLNWASQQNAKLILDGFGMLVEQAAESFFIWRGVRPSTKSLYILKNYDRTR